MNRSGLALGEIIRFYKVPTENLIVIYDDIDIPLGTLRIRPKGSAGTHNGMKSIISSLGSEFPRIRIGIGRNQA
jgi:PTH1 family peptidyl-tRNA hydrolase